MDEQNEITPWYGVINIDAIKSGFTDSALSGNSAIKTNNLEENSVKFVHYPDCQQLIIWLPEYGHNYDKIEIKNLENEEVVFQNRVSDILQGSIQLIIDTLPFPPATYDLKINKADGFSHIISLTKLEEMAPAIIPEVEIPQSDYDGEYKIYRDGTGKILPNTDLILRDQIITKMTAKFSRRLEYTGNLRSGSVIYIEGDKRLEFYTEMGGGNCMFYIDIPTTEHWERVTGIPINERDEVLSFIAQTAGRDQAPSCYYKINERDITYYSD